MIEINGFKIETTNEIHQLIVNEMFVEDVYRYNTIPHEFDAVLDLGGNIGVFSIFASQKAKRIVAVEALPQNIDLFNKNIKLNGLENKITLFEGAINLEGGGFVNMVDKGNGNGQVVPEGGEIVVPTVSLRNIIKITGIQHFDFLKVDIELSEYDLLTGWGADEFNRFDFIGMEFHTTTKERFDAMFDNINKYFEINIIGSYLTGGNIYAKNRTYSPSK